MDNSSLYTLSLPDLKVLGQYVDESRDTSCRSSLIQVTVKEDRAYVGAWEDGMRILNLANLYTPTLTGSLDKTNGFRRLWILGNIAVVDERAYVGAYFGDKPWLAIFDLAGPGDPKVSAQVSLGGEVDRIALTDKIVYAGVTYADREGSTLYLLDATSTEPRQLGAIELSSRIYDVWTQDHLVIIATSDGISIGSVRDPNSPQTIAELPVPDGAYRMALLADTVLATTAQYVGSGQLLAVDLSGPTNPNLIGTFDLPAGRTKIYASDEYVLVGNEPMGLAVLRIDLNGDMPPN